MSKRNKDAELARDPWSEAAVASRVRRAILADRRSRSSELRRLRDALETIASARLHPTNEVAAALQQIARNALGDTK